MDEYCDDPNDGSEWDSTVQFCRRGPTGQRLPLMAVALVVVAILCIVEAARAQVSYPALPGSDPSADEQLPQLKARDGGSNFFVVNVCDFREGCRGHRDSMTGTVKFALDQQFDFVELRGYPSIGYFTASGTLGVTSWWDLWDRLPGSKSAPFLETNYQPGGELSWRAPPSLHRYLAARIGAMHQSNGIGDVLGKRNAAQSRSWNRAYAGMTMALFEMEGLSASLNAALWAPFGDAPVADWSGARVVDYVGHGELGAAIRLTPVSWTDWFLTAKVRERSMQGEFRWRLSSTRGLFGTPGNALKFDAVAHCYFGRGERLLTAEVFTRSCYVGIGF